MVLATTCCSEWTNVWDSWIVEIFIDFNVTNEFIDLALQLFQSAWTISHGMREILNAINYKISKEIEMYLVDLRVPWLFVCLFYWFVCLFISKCRCLYYIILSVSQGRSLARTLTRFAFSHSSSKRFVCHLISLAQNSYVSTALIFNWSYRFKLNDSQCDKATLLFLSSEISNGHNHALKFPFWFLDPLIVEKFKQIKIWRTHRTAHKPFDMNRLAAMCVFNFERRKPSAADNISDVRALNCINFSEIVMGIIMRLIFFVRTIRRSIVHSVQNASSKWLRIFERKCQFIVLS